MICPKCGGNPEKCGCLEIPMAERMLTCFRCGAMAWAKSDDLPEGWSEHYWTIYGRPQKRGDLCGACRSAHDLETLAEINAVRRQAGLRPLDSLEPPE